MKVTYLLFILIILSIFSCGPTTTAIKIDFDDLSTLTAETSSNPTPHPVNLGDTFEVGDIITEKSSGTRIVVLPFQWPPHAPNPPEWTANGHVEIIKDNKSGGSGNEIHFDNACLGVEEHIPKKLEKVTLKFADYGGNINIVENGDLHNEDNFASVISPTSKGLRLKITPSNSTKGTLQLTGTMTKFKFPGPTPPALEDKDIFYSCIIGGGQELWVDDINIFLKP